MDYLDASGSYAGLDVDAECIQWCKAEIAARDPRFSFTHLDVESSSYNPQGAVSASRVTLPFGEGAFDCIVVSSVFTHLGEAGIIRYLHEMHRTLDAQGRVLVSLLLMNDTAESAIRAGATSFVFIHGLGENSWALDPDNPLDGVAVAEKWFQRVAREAGFTVVATEYGNWRERPGWEVQHDWVVLQRAGCEAS